MQASKQTKLSLGSTASVGMNAMKIRASIGKGYQTKKAAAAAVVESRPVGTVSPLKRASTMDSLDSEDFI
jgi:hypothetical protein